MNLKERGARILKELCKGKPDQAALDRLIDTGAGVLGMDAHGLDYLAKGGIFSTDCTTLYRAYILDRFDVFTALLDYGMPPDVTEKGGNTTLVRLAYGKGAHDSILYTEALLAKGADIEKKGEYGMTALICAAEAQNEPFVSCMIQNGAAINACDGAGTPALFYAVDSRNAAIVRQLIAAGADLSIRNDHGNDILGFIADNDDVAELGEIRGVILDAIAARKAQHLRDAVAPVHAGLAAALPLHPPPKMRRR